MSAQEQQQPPQLSAWQLMRQPWTPWFQQLFRFLLGQWVSMLGSAMVQYVLIFYITLATQSGAMMAVATACGFLPQVLISPIAGVWADRYDRKKLAIFADMGIALATLVLAALMLTGYRALTMPFVLLAVRSLGSGIQSPAVSAIVPQLVPERHLLRVNAANTSVQSLIMLVAPALGGWLLATGPLAIVLLVDVATAVIGIVLLVTVAVPRHPRQDETAQHPWHDLADGLRYTWRAPVIRTIISFHAVSMLLIAPLATLTPLLVVRTFGGGERALAINEIVFSGGTLLGGALIAAWGGWRNRLNMMAIACAVLGIGAMLIGLVPMTFVWYLLILVCMGVSEPFYGTPTTTMLQEQTEPEKMGRVFSLMNMVMTLCVPIGVVICGPLADTVSVQTLMWIAGAALLAMAGLLAVNKTLRGVAVRPEQTEEKE